MSDLDVLTARIEIVVERMIDSVMGGKNVLVPAVLPVSLMDSTMQFEAAVAFPILSAVSLLIEDAAR